VTSLTATRVVSNAIDLAWAVPTGTKTSITVQVRNAADTAVVSTITVTPGSATSRRVTGLTAGTLYRFRVWANNAALSGPFVATGQVRALATPGAPVIGTVSRGALGAPLTATVRWADPVQTGGGFDTYRVRTMRMSSALPIATVLSSTFANVPGTANFVTQTLANGNYRFTVQAVNEVGTSAASGRSANVVPR
jgi:predicted phage tail protein